MTKTIQQAVELDASPEELFDIYLDSKRHAAAVASTVTLSRRVGGAFTAFGGALAGRNLAIVPKRLIVQAWRSSSWKPGELDSILILTFEKAQRRGRIRLVHANVPDHAHASIKQGWQTHYWRRWRAYLKVRKAKAR